MEYRNIETLRFAPNRTEHKRFLVQYRRIRDRIIQYLITKGLTADEAQRAYYMLTEPRKKALFYRMEKGL